LDPYYSFPGHRAFIEKLRSSRFPTFPLQDERLVSKIIEGRITPREECYIEDETSPVFLRAQNIEEGYLNFSDSKRLKPEAFREECKAILEDGDIVLTIDGVLLGVAAVHRNGDAPCCISNHMVRLVVAGNILPDFLSLLLNSPAGQRQIKRGITGSAIPGIRTDAIERLIVPLPPLPVQRELVGEMEAARESRRRKLQEADALLSGLDAFLLARLGLIVPESDNRVAYAMPLSAVQRSKQIGADYFHPERVNALRAIQTAKNAERAVRLEDVADFLRDFSTKYEPEEYLGLAGVQSQTGELTETSEEPGKGQASPFEEGDVLFARLRPYLNKVWRAERGGVCSMEFHVIRIKEDITDLLPDYLAAVLRSSIIVAQTKHMMTGNTHPRLANEDVVDLLIPIPDSKIQREIVEELRRRRLEARRLREAAAREWEAAKARFEAKLLSGKGK
jgi:restriction endonuclease S subunit